MFSKKLKTAALAIVAAGAFAGSAQASVIDFDDVRLPSLGYDFGGRDLAFGEPVDSGEIHFHHENGGRSGRTCSARSISTTPTAPVAGCGWSTTTTPATWLQTEYGGGSA